MGLPFLGSSSLSFKYFQEISGTGYENQNNLYKLSIIFTKLCEISVF